MSLNMYKNNRRGYRNSRPRNSSFQKPQKNKKSIYQWTEYDLIKTVEYSKKAQTVAKTTDEEYTANFTFDELLINAGLKQNITRKGYKVPSPIQDQAIPYILEGRDLIGIANTGTGKTAAFLIPLINKACKDKTQKVFIVAPTRELADQIFSEFKQLASGLNLYGALVTGGSSMRVQILELRKNPNFVVGTPGRLKDLIEQHYIKLGEFNNVVLDEADRMVDIGFVNEINFFISKLPVRRQSLFFSATVSKKVEEIISTFVHDPIQVNVKKSDNTINITQGLVRVAGTTEKKVETLVDLLSGASFNKVIVFGNSKWGVQKLSDELTSRGLKADAIHGNVRQSKRRSILEKFKKNQISVLLATDVAARGLDIKNVSHVINYEMPLTYEDYIHRIGRTGRADKTGIALTFVSA
jgi:ATP-dependent RNA helicase RhlE